MRGFKVAKGYDNIPLPQRSTDHSAGYDIEICETITVQPKTIIRAKTGLKAYMQPDEVLQIYPRSSLPEKFGLTIPNNVGIIDADYYENPENDGAIFIQLYNFTDRVATIEKGTRIAQGIFVKYLKTDGDNGNGKTRAGGFGSTGS